MQKTIIIRVTNEFSRGKLPSKVAFLFLYPIIVLIKRIRKGRKVNSRVINTKHLSGSSG